jgi:8-oxo-dGTP diphosphatase
MIPVTRVLPAGSVADPDLSYVIIGARYREQWIFVRHRDRDTWELPAGHIEAGEEPDRAAERELHEETGAINPSLRAVSDYQVSVGNSQAYGRLYLAQVKDLGSLPEFEIAEIKLSGQLPSPLTYPEVQRVLFSLLSLQ